MSDTEQVVMGVCTCGRAWEAHEDEGHTGGCEASGCEGYTEA